MNSETSTQREEVPPKIDLRDVFRHDQSLPPAGSPIVEAEIFRSRAHSADKRIEELRNEIEDLKKEREINNDRWSENLTPATDDMFKRLGAEPVEGTGGA